MKKYIFLLLVFQMFLSCKDETKSTEPVNLPTALEAQISDTINVQNIEKIVPEKPTKILIEDLKNRGFTISSYVDEQTKDTVIMQQYFMVFLKQGSIRGQPEEEAAVLRKEHLEYFDNIKALGYANIIETFDDDDTHVKGMAIYNVPTLKIADSLAHADPMVKAGQLEVEIHPWWAEKDSSLE